MWGARCTKATSYKSKSCNIQNFDPQAWNYQEANPSIYYIFTLFYLNKNRISNKKLASNANRLLTKGHL